MIECSAFGFNGGAEAMVRHLIALGHRRIAMVMGEKGHFDTAERVQGYRQALLDAGIELEGRDAEGPAAPPRARHLAHALVHPPLAEDGHAVIVGDTPKDGEAADSAGFPFLAVATGSFTADELRATNAVLVIDDFATGLDAAIDAIDAIDQSIGAASARR